MSERFEGVMMTVVGTSVGELLKAGDNDDAFCEELERERQPA